LVKIVFAIADLQSKNGGPSRSVSGLAAAVAELAVEVELIALCYPEEADKSHLAPLHVKTTLVPSTGFFRKLKFSAGFRRALRASAQYESVILHDNGLWLPTNHAAASAARETEIPLIVSPRGMLSSWARQFHRFKKGIAWQLYQRRDLRRARLLHATSQAEATALRELGLRQPVAVVPNGVTLPSASANHQPFCSGLRTALFLSRIHPIKGLLDLVEAWQAVRPSGWQAVIAGGDENGHRAEVESVIRGRGLSEQFKFIGVIGDDRKWEVYRSADLFVLPAKSENFGIVVAEALASGVPVVTTKGTPWEELNRHQCGWWVEIGPAPFARALAQAFQLSARELKAMGARGRKLVEDNYTWNAAAKKMLSVYRWLVGEGAKPDCVLWADEEKFRF
jgi:glycosyltransferase involved in cell wall biosynthesis